MRSRRRQLSGRQYRRASPVARCTRSAGVEEQGMFVKGLPRNLGDPAVSTSVSRRQRIEAPVQFRGGAGQQLLPAASRRAVVRGTARRTKESEAGRTMGSRSTPIVPTKLANCRPREPVKGSGVPDYGTIEGKHSDTSCSALCKRDFDG